MSEEILRALMQLFAIISKQDEGTTENQRRYVETFLSSQINSEKVQEYLALYDEKSEKNSEDRGRQTRMRDSKLTSMKDSVRTLTICRKINKTLSRKQKVIVLIRIFELLKAENLYTSQRMGIIETISSVFNISADELDLISRFIRYDVPEQPDSGDILIVRGSSGEEQDSSGVIRSNGLDGLMFILRLASVELYFVRYQGRSEVSLNGLSISSGHIYLFPSGSTLRLPQGTIYYSDVVSKFLKNKHNERISFRAEHISYQFPNGKTGLHDVSLGEEFGLIGIMGASGSGKTTLLNVLSGIEKPSSGTVSINGINVHEHVRESRGFIGYIAQDDCLLEELTVFENLYYGARLCFRDLPEKEIVLKVNETLTNLGLSDIRDIRVGNPLNKKISGGQRKRLNIALELIREPSVLFVDEPTSGLSSKDSENVMDLLKELSVNMKLIFVVIHQPSSDIFKMFDKLLLLDTGGYPIYYGNPIESVIYFKTISKHINAESGECAVCGNVNPELLFNIIEAREVDEFGRYTANRIRSPREWNELFKRENTGLPGGKKGDNSSKRLNIPSKFSQFRIFTRRDIRSKISNLQYMLINLLEAPLLALILTVIIKYSSDPGGRYLFKNNDNIPPYIFMSIIIALFIGLSVSAEEIFRDRRLLKRESFLNLSRSGYLLSKVAILFTLSAFQTFTFVLIGNYILGVKGLFLPYWLVLFSVSCFANILGLNISSAFNSAVTIYILIPLLVIPQMILGGAMFSFDKLNTIIGSDERNAPPIADVMVSRWAYEALAVTQFKDNPYETNFYELDRLESIANYKQVYYLPELEQIISESDNLKNDHTRQSNELLAGNLNTLRNELSREDNLFDDLSPLQEVYFNPEYYSAEVSQIFYHRLDELNDRYIKLFNVIRNRKNELIREFRKKNIDFDQLYRNNYNDFLSGLLKKTTSPHKVIRTSESVSQVVDPIFLLPEKNAPGSFRAHFYAPRKYLFSALIDTLYFNVLVIWVFSLLFCLALYFDVLAKLINKVESLSIISKT